MPVFFTYLPYQTFSLLKLKLVYKNFSQNEALVMSFNSTVEIL